MKLSDSLVANQEIADKTEAHGSTDEESRQAFAVCWSLLVQRADTSYYVYRDGYR